MALIAAGVRYSPVVPDNHFLARRTGAGGEDRRSRARRVTLAFVLVVSVIGLLYVLLPAAAGLDNTWTRISEGNPWWILAAGGLEILSFLSYMLLFRAVFGAGSVGIGWPASVRITLAGVAATRVLAVAGAGGVALTAWALRRAGMGRQEIAARMAAFLILLYGVYMAALVAGGVGLRSGILPGPAPFGLTVIPAAFGAAVIATVLILAALSRDLETAVSRFRSANARSSRVVRALATAPATVASGVSVGLGLVRDRRIGSVGAVGWWAFDIGVLWACLSAFGSPPALAVLVTAYFVGMAANTLPVPGGIGTVDAGMIGALIGFGVDGGLAIVGVLSYRAFAFWIPIIPGAIAYVQLLRSPPVNSPGQRRAAREVGL